MNKKSLLLIITLAPVYFCLATNTAATEEATNTNVSFAEAAAAVSDGFSLAATKLLADAGNSKSQHLLATAYRLGTHGTVDEKLALHWLSKAVENQHAPAIAEMGYHYRYGTLTVDQDESKALSLFQSAAAMGNGYAQAMIGRGYLYGELGLEKDQHAALPYLEKAAKLNVSSALLDLGWMYQEGLAMATDLEKAQDFYQRGAVLGDSGAQYHLATLYWEYPETEDQEKAIYWYQHAVDRGHVLAHYKLGEIYRRGDEQFRNLTRALGLYMRGADYNEPHALTMLGHLYINGIIVVENKQKGHDYLLRAAEQDHPEAQAQLGNLYLSDSNDDWEDSLGLDWLLRAARKGNMYAQKFLTHLYLDRPGFVEAVPTAMPDMVDAANSGFVHGQMLLGYVHYDGPKKDYEQARFWFGQAAEANDAESQYALFYMYYQGQGVEADSASAQKWLQRAADNGSAEALYGLARAYNYGNPRINISKDIDKAYDFFRRSHDAGLTRAANDLAWFLATSPDRSRRDGPKAVEIMEAALAASPRSDGWVDTLAAAYAESGDFDKAIEYQEEAISLAQQTTDLEDINPRFYERLESYQRNQPWRDQALSKPAQGD